MLLTMVHACTCVVGDTCSHLLKEYSLVILHLSLDPLVPFFSSIRITCNNFYIKKSNPVTFSSVQNPLHQLHPFLYFSRERNSSKLDLYALFLYFLFVHFPLDLVHSDFYLYHSTKTSFAKSPITSKLPHGI